jgi:hypothetical protein
MQKIRIRRPYYCIFRAPNTPDLGGKATGSSSAKTTGGSIGKTIGGKKRVISAAARAKMAKAQKERWAKFRAAKAKGKQ